MRTLLLELFELLDKEELSDSGRVFRPNQISSCRVMDGLRIEQLLKELRYIVSSDY